MDEDQHRESSKSSQKKLKAVEFKKKKHVRFLLPCKSDKKKKPSSPGDTDEAVFRCDCRYCQKCVGNTSRVSVATGTEAISQSSSWEKLTLDLSNLTLNPKTTQPCLVPDTMPKSENKTQWQRKNKRMFQKVLHEWTE